MQREQHRKEYEEAQARYDKEIAALEEKLRWAIRPPQFFRVNDANLTTIIIRLTMNVLVGTFFPWD